MEFFKHLLSPDFMPHGYCYLWDPRIVWLNVISDVLITLSYYCIPVVLIYFIRKRRDLPFNWVFWMFGAFILACGTTHLMEVWNVWHASYLLAGAVKGVTAGVSVVTAVRLVPLVPEAVLRTPLTCIHQFVSLMLDGLAGTLIPEQREHLETVFRSANQLRAMITDLLEATRAESGKIAIEPHCVVMSDVIRQAIAMLQGTAQAKGVGLEAGLDIRIPLVYADSKRVLQVLTNLIDNAIKFTPADGSVMVKACPAANDPDFVHVSVADTGRGISPEAKATIFERLYQDPNSIDDSRKGLGLGLYISKELVQLHGGQIWVESQLSHGSTFVFTLPLFSLANFLAPIITHQGHLRDSLSLITVELTPLDTPFAGNWEDMRQYCLQILEPCILGGKDAILPALGNTEQGETLVIVASTDEHGASVVEKRMREQLEHAQRLRSSCAFELSSVGVKLPAADRQEPVEKLVQEVADSIIEMTMTARRRKSPAN